jgi:hypothetical protein
MNTTASIEVAGPDQAAISAAREQFLASPAVLKEIAKGAKLLSFRVAEEAKPDRSPGTFDSFKAVVYNYTDNYAINANGKLNKIDKARLLRNALQPLPTQSELSNAIELASKEPSIKAASANNRSRLFPGMPGVISETLADGRTTRRLPLVLQATAGQSDTEVLAVDPLNGEVTRGIATHPARADFLHDRVLPIPDFTIQLPQANDLNHVWFTIKDATTEEVIWRMLIVRPAASSGLNGSGLELRYVDYKGKRVLYRAHAPIWNVLYEGRIKEFRDWTNAEVGFDATGTLFKDAAGNDLGHFILCDAPPQTVFETGVDGTFNGVAFFNNPDGSWTVSTMMRAGWYRYYMAYTFFDDGTLKPRIGFTTNGTNPYAGVKHFHNAYFRFDFDISSAGNNLITNEQTLFLWDPVARRFNINTTKTPLAFEIKLNRLILDSYLIEDKLTQASYRVIPGANDGTATGDPNNYSKGDIWALAYHENEIDDGVQQLASPSDAQLDKFLSGEPIDGKDVVLWYGVHFTHDPMHTLGEKNFGPDLHPEGTW